MSTRTNSAPPPPAAAQPREAAAEAEGNVRAVDRALAILRTFEDGGDALTLVEIARRAGLHLTTALRLLGTLESHGFVQRLPAGGYALGPQLLVLGERFRRGRDRSADKKRFRRVGIIGARHLGQSARRGDRQYRPERNPVPAKVGSG